MSSLHFFIAAIVFAYGLLEEMRVMSSRLVSSLMIHEIVAAFKQNLSGTSSYSGGRFE